MNSIKSTKNIDAMTVSELRAMGLASGQKPTETITLWDIDIAAAFGVTINPVMDNVTNTELSYDEIELELDSKPEYGWIKVTRDAGKSEWAILHEPSWNEYTPEILRSTIQDLSFAADIAEWLNKGR